MIYEYVGADVVIFAQFSHGQGLPLCHRTELCRAPRGAPRVSSRPMHIFAARKTILSRVSRVEHVEGAKCLKGRRRLGIEIDYWCYNAEHAFNKEISPN